MKRLNKYLVLKNSDIENALDQEEKVYLDSIRARIMLHRQKQKRKLNKDYVVVSESLPFYEKVWEMMEAHVDGEEIRKRWAYLSYDEGKENLSEQLSILNAIHRFNHFVEAIYKSSSSPERFDPQIKNSFSELQEKYPGCIKMRETL